MKSTLLQARNEFLHGKRLNAVNAETEIVNRKLQIVNFLAVLCHFFTLKKGPNRNKGNEISIKKPRQAADCHFSGSR